MAKPALHHVTVKTTRLQAMVDWYATVIGAEVIFQDAVAAWLTNDGANHRFALLAVPGISDDPGKRDHAGLHHSAYEFETFGDLVETYVRLRAEGIVPAFCLDHGLTLSLYYADPDGNHVELQVDGFGSWQASSEWMNTSPVFADNPIGVFFDPEAMLADHEAGVGFDEIHRRARASVYLPEIIPNIGLPDVAS
jgi:catechol-2,3-dioxygenase